MHAQNVGLGLPAGARISTIHLHLRYRVRIGIEISESTGVAYLIDVFKEQN